MGLAGEGTLLRLLQHLMSASLSMQPRRSVRKLCASSRQVRGLRAEVPMWLLSCFSCSSHERAPEGLKQAAGLQGWRVSERLQSICSLCMGVSANVLCANDQSSQGSL